MNIALLVGTLAVITALVRLVVGLRSGEDDVFRPVLMSAGSGAALIAGLASLPYPLLHQYADDFTKSFYKDWINDPLFIGFAGLGLLLTGIQGLRTEFRKEKKS